MPPSQLQLVRLHTGPLRAWQLASLHWPCPIRSRSLTPSWDSSIYYSRYGSQASTSLLASSSSWAACWASVASSERTAPLSKEIFSLFSESGRRTSRHSWFGGRNPRCARGIRHGGDPQERTGEADETQSATGRARGSGARTRGGVHRLNPGAQGFLAGEGFNAGAKGLQSPNQPCRVHNQNRQRV